MRAAIAVLLVSSLAGISPVAFAQADSVSLGGRIFQADGSTPYANVTVRVMDKATGAEVGTTTTGTDGSYAFDALSPGTYTFEVEVPDGVFQLDRAIQLGSDEHASISFTVKPTAVSPPSGDHGGGGPGMSKKKKGLLIALITAGAIGVAFALDNDDKKNEGSPFTPGS
jgi:hypothetical protein